MAVHDAEIRTERLRLRPPRRDDAARLADLLNDFDIARMTSRIPHPYSLQDAQDYLERVETGDPARSRPFQIEHPDFGLIGGVGVFYRDETSRLPEIGYWLGRTFWGRGFATEAACACMDWGKRAWGRRAVIASHFLDNPASGEVLIKAGFLPTGEVKPMECVARGGPALGRTLVWLA